MTNNELFDLMARFDASGIQSLKLSSGDFSLELHKGGAPAAAAAPARQAVEPPAPGFSSPAQSGTVITAPLVGTYYAAPTPDAPPFVRAGDKVSKGQTLCLIEAMKTLSEIPAPCDCVITEVLKDNGALAAFDEPLFRYQPC